MLRAILVGVSLCLLALGVVILGGEHDDAAVSIDSSAANAEPERNEPREVALRSGSDSTEAVAGTETVEIIETAETVASGREERAQHASRNQVQAPGIVIEPSSDPPADGLWEVSISGRVIDSFGRGVRASLSVYHSADQSPGDARRWSPYDLDRGEGWIEDRVLVPPGTPQLRIVAGHVNATAECTVTVPYGGGSIRGLELVLPDDWTAEVELSHRGGRVLLERVRVEARLATDAQWQACRAWEHGAESKRAPVPRSTAVGTQARVLWRATDDAPPYELANVELAPARAEDAHVVQIERVDLSDAIHGLTVQVLDGVGAPAQTGWVLLDPDGFEVAQCLDDSVFVHPTVEVGVLPSPEPRRLGTQGLRTSAFDGSHVSNGVEAFERLMAIALTSPCPDEHRFSVRCPVHSRNGGMSHRRADTIDVPAAIARSCRPVAPGIDSASVRFTPNEGWSGVVNQPMRRRSLTLQGSLTVIGSRLHIVGLTTNGTGAFHFGERQAHIDHPDLNLPTSFADDPLKSAVGRVGCGGPRAYGTGLEGVPLRVWVYGNNGSAEVDASALVLVEGEDGGLVLDIDQETSDSWWVTYRSLE